MNGVSKTQKGSVTGGDLQKSHSLELPAFWTEGDRGAFDTGILWLSQDVYENLDRTQSSTFHFGMTDPSFVGTINAGKSFDAALASLTKDVEALTSTDAFLSTTEPERRMWMLRINQKDVKVQVIKGTNWFGDFIVLDNPQNPLVLSVTPREGLSGDLFDGFFGYEITEIQGIQE